MVEVPKVRLNNGFEIPQVGFGLWKVSTESAADVVYQAIKTGYRLFDVNGAYDYGNEREAALGVKRALEEGIVKREDLVIVSKLWNAFHEKERVEPIVRQQLEWWGVDYFDVFYIPFPIALEYRDPKEQYPVGWKDAQGNVVQGKAPIQETWQAMEHLVDIGLAKSIGICNFQGSLVIDLLRYARIRPAILQLEIHPYPVQEEIVRFAQSESIAVTADSSFGPLSFVELEWKKAVDIPKLFDQPVVSTVAQKYNKTPAQVLLGWATQRGLAVIPKTSNPKRMVENLDCNNFDLTSDEMKAISSLNRNMRFNNPPDYLGTLYIFA